MKTEELVLVGNLLSNMLVDSNNTSQATADNKAKKKKKVIRVAYIVRGNRVENTNRYP